MLFEEHPSALEIFEESLSFDSQLVTKSQIKAGFTDADLNGNWSEIIVRDLAYPYGRCLSFSPSFEGQGAVRNVLYLRLNDSALLSSNIFNMKKIRLYFIDKVNSARIYPNNEEVVEEPIHLIQSGPRAYTFNTKIFRSQNIPGDPSLDCVDYTIERSFHDCIQKELKHFFNSTIGCLPPPLFSDHDKICNRTFNSSAMDKESLKDGYVTLWQLYRHDYKFECKPPCTRNRYLTSLLFHEQNKGKPYTEVIVAFDATVEVVHTKFSSDVESVIFGFGSSVANGRLLLWIIVSLLGIPQVTFIYLKMISKLFISDDQNNKDLLLEPHEKDRGEPGRTHIREGIIQRRIAS